MVCLRSFAYQVLNATNLTDGIDGLMASMSRCLCWLCLYFYIQEEWEY